MLEADLDGEEGIRQLYVDDDLLVDGDRSYYSTLSNHIGEDVVGSFVAEYEVDCSTMRQRSTVQYFYLDLMAKGTPRRSPNSNPVWESPAPDTPAQLFTELSCEGADFWRSSMDAAKQKNKEKG